MLSVRESNNGEKLEMHSFQICSNVMEAVKCLMMMYTAVIKKWTANTAVTFLVQAAVYRFFYTLVIKQTFYLQKFEALKLLSVYYSHYSVKHFLQI